MKFSIIIAVKNAVKTIEQALSSLFSQKDCDYQLIVIDGQSTDGTLDILNLYVDRIDTLISESDKGIYDAFNKGIQNAKGDIIYFLNSDDFLHTNTALKEVNNTFIEYDADLVYCNLNICDMEGQIKRIVGNKLSNTEISQGVVPSHTSVFVRRSVFKKTGLFDLRYKISSDYDFMLKCFLNPDMKIHYMNHVISNFREGGISHSYKNSLRMKTEHDIIASRNLKKIYNSAEEVTNNSARFRLWLEKLLLEKIGITTKLKNLGIKKIAIFGTKKVALCVLQDCRNSKIEVLAFIDNDEWIIGELIEDIPVLNARYKNSYNGVDAVITSVESSYDTTIKETIQLLTKNSIMVCSWKELVDENDK